MDTVFVDDTDEVESSDYGSFGGFFHYQEPLCGQLHITDTEDWDLFLPYIDVYADDRYEGFAWSDMLQNA